jgi:hypothetical protein
LYEGDNSAANKGPAPYSVTFSNLLVTSPGATDAGTTDALSTDAPSTDDPSTSHLVAYYPFHGDGQDLSGNGNNAIVTKNVVFQPGEDGLAATFDGSSSYFQVAESSSLMLTGPLTIAAWVNPGREDDLNCIVDKDYGLIGYNLYLRDGRERPVERLESCRRSLYWLPNPDLCEWEAGGANCRRQSFQLFQRPLHRYVGRRRTVFSGADRKRPHLQRRPVRRRSASAGIIQAIASKQKTGRDPTCVENLLIPDRGYFSTQLSSGWSDRTRT